MYFIVLLLSLGGGTHKKHGLCRRARRWSCRGRDGRSGIAPLQMPDSPRIVALSSTCGDVLWFPFESIIMMQRALRCIFEVAGANLGCAHLTGHGKTSMAPFFAHASASSHIGRSCVSRSRPCAPWSRCTGDERLSHRHCPAASSRWTGGAMPQANLTPAGNDVFSPVNIFAYDGQVEVVRHVVTNQILGHDFSPCFS